MYIVNLTVGTKIRIVSKEDPDLFCDIDLFQSVVIPANLGKYEVQDDNREFSTLVLLRWKKG